MAIAAAVLPSGLLLQSVTALWRLAASTICWARTRFDSSENWIRPHPRERVVCCHRLAWERGPASPRCEDWPLAGTHRGHAGLENLLQKANDTVETTFPEPPEFIAQGDRVLVVGFATGSIKATNRTWEDHWVFAITLRNCKLTNVREYVDTQALARASKTAASPRL